MPQRLFRVIVGGRYAGTAEESKEKSLFGTCKIGPEGFGRFETKWLFADGDEFPDKFVFDLGRSLPGEIAGFELLPGVTVEVWQSVGSNLQNSFDNH